MPVLIDGTEVPGDSREWAMECLARWVLKLKPIERRREWLDDFQRRDPELGIELRDTITAVHAAKKR
jgi:hypothetical protein